MFIVKIIIIISNKCTSVPLLSLSISLSVYIFFSRIDDRGFSDPLWGNRSTRNWTVAAVGASDARSQGPHNYNTGGERKKSTIIFSCRCRFCKPEAYQIEPSWSLNTIKESYTFWILMFVVWRHQRDRYCFAKKKKKKNCTEWDLNL